jgi:hypothetical protein
VPISTKVVSSNSAYGEVFLIQHYVIKVCQWLEAGQWFSPGTPVSSTNKTDHDITEITLTPQPPYKATPTKDYDSYKAIFSLQTGWPYLMVDYYATVLWIYLLYFEY